MSVIRLHLACHPPKTTAQMKRVVVINGRPRFFHSARQQREAHTWAVLLRPHRPRVPMAGPVALSLVLVYPHLRSTPKRDRDRWRPKVSKPDCDNAAKHLIDTLVQMRFLANDQQIAVLQISKWHGPEDQVGIRLEIHPIAAVHQGPRAHGLIAMHKEATGRPLPRPQEDQVSTDPKSPIELASDIGAKAFDLHCYGDALARLALSEVARVNPEMLAWLRDRLLDITAQRPVCATSLVADRAGAGVGEQEGH